MKRYLICLLALFVVLCASMSEAAFLRPRVKSKTVVVDRRPARVQRFEVLEVPHCSGAFQETVTIRQFRF